MNPAFRAWLLRILAPALFFLLLAAGWQWVALNLRSILPPLQAVAGDLLARPGFYAGNLWVTVQSALTGLVVGGGVAILLAVDTLPDMFRTAVTVSCWLGAASLLQPRVATAAIDAV